MATVTHKRVASQSGQDGQKTTNRPQNRRPIAHSPRDDGKSNPLYESRIKGKRSAIIKEQGAPIARSLPNKSNLAANIQIDAAQPAGAGFEFSLAKAFLLLGYLFGTFLTVICAMDLLAGYPFSRVSLEFDTGFLFAGMSLIYLSWNARDGC